MKKKTYILTFLMMLCSFAFGQTYHWDNPNGWQQNMVIYGNVTINGKAPDSNLDLELGAFCGNELRGREKVSRINDNKEFIVYGAQGHAITFKLYDCTNDRMLDEYECSAKVTFQEGEFVVGKTFNFTSKNHWNPAHNTNSNMTVTARVTIDGANVNGDYEIGAFIGETVCGSARVSNSIAYIVISNNIDDNGNPINGTNNVTFKLWNHKSNLLANEITDVTVNYEHNATYGSQENPFVINFNEAVAEVAGEQFATLQAAVNATTTTNTEVKVLRDFALDNTVTIADDQTVVLNLGGRTVTTAWENKSAGKHYYAFTNNGTLTIQGNGIINARGIFNYGTMTLTEGTINAIDGNGGYGVRNYDGSVFTMNGGTIATTLEDDKKVDKGGYDATTLRVDAGATAIINGGVINNICDYTFAIDNAGTVTVTVNAGTVTSVHSTVSNNGTMTINGGSFTCNGLEGITAHALVAWDGSTTTINGGTFDGKDNYNGFNVDADEGANVVITGGEFLYVHSGSLYGKGTITVSGGTFFDKVADKRLAQGYICEKEGNVYKVVRGLKGEGTEEKPFIIMNLDDLVFFRDHVNAGGTKYNATGKWVALGADIDMASVDWNVNIGDDCNATFDGIFDGKGFKLSNLNSVETTQKTDGYICTGLFGAIAGNAVVKNFTIENVTINTGNFTGNNVAAVVGFAYKAKGSIENVHVIGNININASKATGVGAILGYDYYSPALRVNKCVVAGNAGSAIVGKSYVGGAVGYASTKIALNTNTVEKVSVTGTGSVGAIAGIMNAGGSAADNTVKNVALTTTGELWANSAAVVAGTITSGGVTVANTTVENVTANNAAASIVGGVLVEKPTTPIVKVPAKNENVYYTTHIAALSAQGDNVTFFVPYTVEAGETLTIDKNVTYTSNVLGEAMITNKGTLTITGSVDYTYTGQPDATYGKGNYTINNSGTLTVNGNVENKTKEMSHASYAINTNAGATLNVKDNGKVLNLKGHAIRMVSFGTAANNVNINGGYIEGTRALQVQLPSGSTSTAKPEMNLAISGGELKSNEETYNLAVYVYSNGQSAENLNIDITGGTFNGNVAINDNATNTMKPGSVNVQGGTFNGQWGVYSYANDTNNTIAITGGAFKTNYSEKYSENDGYIFEFNGTYYIVNPGTYVVRNTTTGQGYTTLRAAVEAAENIGGWGQTITLLKDITLEGGYADATEGLRIEKSLTLDGAGHTIYCGNFEKGIRVYNNSNANMPVMFKNVTVINNNNNGRCIDTRSGKINLYLGTNVSLIAQEGNSQPLTIGGSEAITKVSIAGATIDAGNSGYGVICFVNVEGGIMVQSDAKVTGYAAFYFKQSAKNVTLDIQHSTCIGINNHQSEGANDFGTIVVEGKNNNIYVKTQNATVKAIAESTAAQAVFLIKKGASSNSITIEGTPEVITEGENAYWAMIDAEVAASTIIKYGEIVGATVHTQVYPAAEAHGIQFMTLEEAVRYAKAESTVTVVNDHVTTTTAVVKKDMTIDFNNKAITGDIYPVVRIQNNANVTVKNGNITNGDYIFTLGSSDQTTAGNLTIENGTYVGETTVASVTKGLLTINGGEFSISDVDTYDYAYVINCVDDNYKDGSAKVAIKGGKFYGFNPENNAAEGAGTDFCAEGYFAVEASENVYEVVEGLIGKGTEAEPFLIRNLKELKFFRDHVNAGKTKYNAEDVYVALAANIDMATEDWSVNIGDDCNYTFDGIFDGKNHTISNLNSTETAPKADGYICTGLFGAIYGNAVVKNLTIENVNIEAEYTGNNVAAVVGFVYNGIGSIENVTVKNVKIDAPNAYGVGAIVGYSYSSNNFTINGCKVNDAEIAAVSGAGAVIGYCGNSNVIGCTVDDVTIEATGLVGGVAGIALAQTVVENNTVKNATLTTTVEFWVNSAAIAVGTMAGNGLTVANTTFENVSASKMVGSVYAEHPTTAVPAVQARIGNVYYGTFDAALAAAQTGNTITVISPVVVAKDAAYDMTGITVAGENVYPIFRIQNGATMTVENANITNATDYVFVLGASDSSSFGNLTIEGGKYHGATSVASVTYGTLTVNGGEFSVEPYQGSYAYLINCIDANYSNKTAKVVVKGGIFHNWNPENNAAEGEGTNFCDANYYALELETGLFIVLPKTEIKQSTNLDAGWNWFSLYVDLNGEAGLGMLRNSLTNGLNIKNQDEFTNYDANGQQWYGSLSSVKVNDMYMINVGSAQTIELNAYQVNPADYEFTLNSNWTWIGYPSMYALPISTALNGFTPTVGDRIKSQDAFAEYTENDGWQGSLMIMEPGEGFMYFNKSGEKTLVYSATNGYRGEAPAANITAANNLMVPNMTKYANNMNITAVVNIDGEELMTEDFEVAVFAGEELRGSARPIYIESIDRYMLFITVYGEENEELTFKYYDLNSGEELSLFADSKVMFEINSIIGSVEQPSVLNYGTLSIDETSASSFNVYPNPVNRDNAISFETTFDKVEVYNSLGVVVAEYANVDKIDGIETAGIYVIKVKNDNVVKYCRVIVK